MSHLRFAVFIEVHLIVAQERYASDVVRNHDQLPSHPYRLPHAGRHVYNYTHIHLAMIWDPGCAEGRVSISGLETGTFDTAV